MSNKEGDVQIKITSSGFKKWKIAEKIGIADTTFSKWLRRDLPPDRKARVLVAIDELAKEAIK